MLKKYHDKGKKSVFLGTEMLKQYLEKRDGIGFSRMQ